MLTFDKVLAFLAAACGGVTITAISAPGVMPKWVAIIVTVVGLGSAALLRLPAQVTPTGGAEP